MAMLAERRERKRYNLVPRGKALYDDGNRFGTRMLEKMGWAKGKGLGANENGEKDFVRIRYKHDNEGLGFQDRNDQWTQHENSFDGLLKLLNNGGVDKPCEEDIPAAVGFGFQKESKPFPKVGLSGESLEEKSKKSKARVHYMKFTRGKDISRYSEKDLANIFGRKSLMNENSDDKTSRIASDEEKEAKQPTFGVTTICSGTSINDYFKAKMAAVCNKSKAKGNQSNCENDDLEKSEEHGTGEIHNTDVQTAEISKKRSKKRKHQELECEEAGNIEESATEKNCSLDTACKGTGEDASSFKKKKRKIIPDSEVDMNEMENKLTDGLKIEAQPVMSKKKSKRKEKTRVESEDCADNQMGQYHNEQKCNYGETQTKSEKKSKKKSKQFATDDIEDESKLIDENPENFTVETCETSVKKSKRRNKNDGTCNMSGKEEVETLSLPETEYPKDLAAANDDFSATQKQKTKSSETCDPQAETPSPTSKSLPIEVDTPKKKKKKSKKSVDFEIPADFVAPEVCVSEDVTPFETKKSKKAKKNKPDLESNHQLLPSTSDSADANDSKCGTKKSKTSKKSKSENSVEMLGENSPEFAHKIELTGSSTENMAQSGNASILELPTDSVPSGKDPTVVAPTAITITTVSNEFKFPELNRRKRKKKPKENPALDATLTEQPTPCEPIAIASPVEEVNYKLNSFTAEKFYNVNIGGFPGSNFPFINGYGLNGRLKLEISRRPGDELKVEKFYGKQFYNVQQLEDEKRMKRGLKPKTVERTFFPANLV